MIFRFCTRGRLQTKRGILTTRQYFRGCPGLLACVHANYDDDGDDDDDDDDDDDEVDDG